MLIIWLQGIWLPQHGYSFERTPLWAGIYMVPLTVGFLIAGPLSGILSDRYGARPFATGGMLGAAGRLRAARACSRSNFGYLWFALALLVMGLSMGMFASPNRAAVMNRLPPDQRGAGAGNDDHVPELGQRAVDRHLLHGDHPRAGRPACPPTSSTGWWPRGCRSARRTRWPACRRSAASSPPSSATTRSSSWCPPSVLAHLPAGHAAYLTGRSFFPTLVSPAFKTGLGYAFDFAIGCSIVAAIASLLRGGRYIHGQAEPTAEAVQDGDEQRTLSRVS